MAVDLLAASAVVRLARDQRHALVHRQTHDRENVAEASCEQENRVSKKIDFQVWETVESINISWPSPAQTCS